MWPYIYTHIIVFLSLYIFILDTVKLYLSIINFETQAVEAGYVRSFVRLNVSPQHLNWCISWNIHYGVVVRILRNRNPQLRYWVIIIGIRA